MTELAKCIRAPEIDISELESLFSAASISDGAGPTKVGRRGSSISKPAKTQLVSVIPKLVYCAG